MSASTKKKLRSAERAEKLTQKQLEEQKEAKKLKLATGIFVSVIALMLCFAIVITAVKTVENSGIREKNTVALTLNEHEISNAELNYYYIDAVNAFINEYGSYVSLLGLDTTKPLNEQIIDEETGMTWADDFMTAATENAKSVYALNDAAKAAGFTMSEEDQTNLEANLSTVELYAIYSYGYPDMDTYLKTMYGHGASEETYREYCTMNYLADAFQSNYAGTLTYEDADLREAEAENYDAYTSYSYNYYYINASSLTEGTEYTDEEYAAAVKQAEEYANTLIADVDSVEAFDAAIAALPMNAENATAASNATVDTLYNSVNSIFRDWVVDSSRKAGDMTVIANTSATTDESGKEPVKVNGYYAVIFGARNENNNPMSNVRHILVAFEGGTLDENGYKIYSDTEKNEAKAAAELLLAKWQNGEATEESFAELANKESDDGDGTTGGLYEDINPSSNYVTNFLNWALEDHKPGDTGIVETEYGYHVMYYSGDSDMTYRDFMITSDLQNKDLNAWYTELVNTVESKVLDTQYISTDLVLSSGQ